MLQFDVERAAKLLEHGGRAVGLVVLLVADAPCGDQSARKQARQLAVHGADAHAGQAHDLVRVEAARRIAVEEAQYALLRLREERIGDR